MNDAPGTVRPDRAVAVDIPPGYHEMPLTDIDRILTAVGPVVSDAFPEELATDIPLVIDTLRTLLEVLASKYAVYCGIGIHAAADGRPIASWLTVSLLNYGGEQNPRQVVLELAERKLAENEPGVVEPIDLAGRPMLFSEAVRTYPAPQLENLPDIGDTSTAYQMEALIPSDDGTTVAAIEFATASVADGPDYRAMLVGMAASVEFRQPGEPAWSLDL